MIEMRVAGLAIDATSRNPMILLIDPSGRRQVAVWIDHSQAHNIIAGIQPTSSKSPLSHDLMIALLEIGGLILEKVIIHAIEGNKFQAVLKLRDTRSIQKGEEEKAAPSIELEARPSDAIALAVRTKCSIWMLEKVFAETSIPVDVDADEEDKDEFHRFIDEISPAALVRHLKAKGDLSDNPFDASDDERDLKK